MGILKNRQEKARRTSVTKFAAASGLLYSENDPTGRFWALRDTDLPGFIYSNKNVLSGRWRGLSVTEADFSTFVMKRENQGVGLGFGYMGGLGPADIRYSALVAELPAELPDLVIQRKITGLDPWSAGSKWLAELTLLHALRYHVESGSTEFNRMFQVTTEDTTFAAKLIDASMMKWLPSAGPPFIKLHGCNLVLVYGSLLPASGLAAIFDTAKGFTDHIPRQIWAEYGTR